MAYEGISFLNVAQQNLIRAELAAETMFSNLERSLSYRDEDDLQAACSSVAQWLPTAGWGDSLPFDIADTKYSLIYFMHKEIRRRFDDVWTFAEPKQVLNSLFMHHYAKILWIECWVPKIQAD